MKGSNVVNVEQYSRSWLKDRTLCMENVENALFIVMNLRKILSQFHETETDKN
jgi:hypothetical protein